MQAPPQRIWPAPQLGTDGAAGAAGATQRLAPPRPLAAQINPSQQV
jgi:hypothetical protein